MYYLMAITMTMITATKATARMSATITPVTVEMRALSPIPVTEHVKE